MLKARWEVVATSLVLLSLGFLLVRHFLPASKNISNELHSAEKIDFSSSTSVYPDAQKITFWIKAHSFPNAPDGTRVLSWIDSGPKKIKLEALSAAADPILKNYVPGKIATVVFSKDSYLESFNVLGSDLIDPIASTAAIVFKPSAQLLSISELFGWGDCGDSRYLVHISPGMVNFHFGSPNNHTDSVPLKSLSESEFNLLILNKDENRSVIELNGMRVGALANTNTLDVGRSHTLTIGSSACRGNFQGEIAEIIFLKNLSENERLNLTRALAEKYSINIF